MANTCPNLSSWDLLVFAYSQNLAGLSDILAINKEYETNFLPYTYPTHLYWCM